MVKKGLGYWLFSRPWYCFPFPQLAWLQCFKLLGMFASAVPLNVAFNNTQIRRSPAVPFILTSKHSFCSIQPHLYLTP